MIRWKKSDYISLGKAVSDFNKKIDELMKEESNLVLPEKIKYSDIKSQILTRKQLKREISDLRRFLIPGQEETMTLDSGEEISRWEKENLERAIRSERKTLTKQLKESPEGFGMGSEERTDIERKLRDLGKIGKVRGKELERLKYRVLSQARDDYKMRKALIYRDNYLKEMTKYQNFEGYDLLMQKLNSIQNPLAFYEFMSQNVLAEDLTYQSDQFYTQQEFYQFLEDLGIIINP